MPVALFYVHVTLRSFDFTFTFTFTLRCVTFYVCSGLRYVTRLIVRYRYVYVYALPAIYRLRLITVLRLHTALYALHSRFATHGSRLRLDLILRLHTYVPLRLLRLRCLFITIYHRFTTRSALFVTRLHWLIDLHVTFSRLVLFPTFARSVHRSRLRWFTVYVYRVTCVVYTVYLIRCSTLRLILPFTDLRSFWCRVLRCLRLPFTHTLPFVTRYLRLDFTFVYTLIPDYRFTFHTFRSLMRCGYARLPRLRTYHVHRLDFVLQLPGYVAHLHVCYRCVVYRLRSFTVSSRFTFTILRCVVTRCRVYRLRYCWLILRVCVTVFYLPRSRTFTFVISHYTRV